MAEALGWRSLRSASHLTTRLSRPHRTTQPATATTLHPRDGIRCKAVEIGIAAALPATKAAKRKSINKYEIENLTTWLLKQEQAGHIDAELTVVLSSISLACKQIASLLQRSSVFNLTGAHGTINIQGEDQKKLDVISNEVDAHTYYIYRLIRPISGIGLGVKCQADQVDTKGEKGQKSAEMIKGVIKQLGGDHRFLEDGHLFCSCLRSSERTGIIASKEEDVPVAVEETYSSNYIVVFDPINGSANNDTSMTTGSIFRIYGPDKQCLVNLDDDSTLDQDGQECVVSVCQPGSNLLAARYCLYSSSVVFTLSIGRGVYAFTLDTAYGEFVLTHANIKIPNAGRIYSFNEGNYDLFDAKL
ncbi:hypothetical protein SASPL_102060 [Salvia splendens]|uniref:Fructose-1-6-bisphosphatase class I N-terminal domain-containing protein n=1 Tax=Salvia splendens TaxID=180675 RepID=A0A8X8YRX0_SALSN|nr:hypothetical protein SASPL_102060 [Salvia splendens]